MKIELRAGFIVFEEHPHTKKLFVPHGKNSLSWGDIFIMKI